MAAACVEAAAAWDVEAEASQAEAEGFPAEVPVVGASRAAARERGRAAEDSPKARRSVAHGPAAARDWGIVLPSASRALVVNPE